jgi:putative phosphoesterase
MRVAVLADVHANAPALRAVLDELDSDPVDAIVAAGDLVSGPLNAEVLDLLSSRSEPVHWVRGNGESDALEADPGRTDASSTQDSAIWTAASLDERRRDELRSWPISLCLDDVRFCHGTPRDEHEIITRATPDEILAEALSEVTESLVVGGHTHQQMVRRVDDRITYVNAGSVGFPYEDAPGAYWLIVADGHPELRRTSYDVEAALREMRTAGFTGLDELVDGSLVNPADPAWVTAFFEHTAGRGEDPGEQRPRPV